MEDVTHGFDWTVLTAVKMECLTEDIAATVEAVPKDFELLCAPCGDGRPFGTHLERTLGAVV